MKKSTWAARCAAAAIAVGCLLTLSDFAGAQERFPNKPIRLIVPFNAGGAADIVAQAYWPIDNREAGSTDRGRESSRRHGCDRVACCGSRNGGWLHDIDGGHILPCCCSGDEERATFRSGEGFYSDCAHRQQRAHAGLADISAGFQRPRIDRLRQGQSQAS